MANNNPVNSIKIQALLTFPRFSVISKVIKAIFVRRSVAMSREGLYVCMHVYIEQRARRRVYYQKSMPSLSLFHSPCRQRGHGPFISAFVDDARAKNAHITLQKPKVASPEQRYPPLDRGCRARHRRKVLRSLTVYNVLVNAAAC